MEQEYKKGQCQLLYTMPITRAHPSLLCSRKITSTIPLSSSCRKGLVILLENRLPALTAFCFLILFVHRCMFFNKITKLRFSLPWYSGDYKILASIHLSFGPHHLQLVNKLKNTLLLQDSSHLLSRLLCCVLASPTVESAIRHFYPSHSAKPQMGIAGRCKFNM